MFKDYNELELRIRLNIKYRLIILFKIRRRLNLAFLLGLSLLFDDRRRLKGLARRSVGLRVLLLGFYTEACAKLGYSLGFGLELRSCSLRFKLTIRH